MYKKYFKALHIDIWVLAKLLVIIVKHYTLYKGQVYTKKVRLIF